MGWPNSMIYEYKYQKHIQGENYLKATFTSNFSLRICSITSDELYIWEVPGRRVNISWIKISKRFLVLRWILAESKWVGDKLSIFLHSTFIKMKRWIKMNWNLCCFILLDQLMNWRQVFLSLHSTWLPTKG